MASCVNDPVVDGKKTSTTHLPLSLSGSVEICAENTKHSDELLKGLYEQYKAGRFCDVSLILEEKEIQAHKVVLAASCRFFEAMFSDNFKDGTQESLELPALDDKTGTALIEFAYTGKVEISSGNVQDLLAGANFLEGFQFVEKSCCDFLTKEMNERNVLGILQLADTYSLETLKKDAKLFALRHFAEVLNSEEFVEVSDGLLSDLLSENGLLIVQNEIVKLRGEQERVIAEGLLKYLGHNPEKSKASAGKLLANVDLPLLKLPYLEALKTNKLLSDAECANLINKAIEMKEEKKLSKTTEECDWVKQRGCGEYQMWIGRNIANSGHVDTEVEKFNDIDRINLQKDFITGMKLWIRRWDDRPVLGGIKVEYSNGTTAMHGSDKAQDVHEFQLEADERITKLEAQSGWMVDQLKFTTNKGRELGPYGGSGGRYQPEKTPGSYCYLACMQGSVVSSQGDLGITRLQFIWKVFRFPGEKQFPDHKETYHWDLDEFNEWDEYDEEYYDDDYDYDVYEDYDDIPDDWYDNQDVYDEFPGDMGPD